MIHELAAATAHLICGWAAGRVLKSTPESAIDQSLGAGRRVRGSRVAVARDSWDSNDLKPSSAATGPSPCGLRPSLPDHRQSGSACWRSWRRTTGRISKGWRLCAGNLHCAVGLIRGESFRKHLTYSVKGEPQSPRGSNRRSESASAPPERLAHLSGSDDDQLRPRPAHPDIAKGTVTGTGRCFE